MTNIPDYVLSLDPRLRAFPRFRTVRISPPPVPVSAQASPFRLPGETGWKPVPRSESPTPGCDPDRTLTASPAAGREHRSRKRQRRPHRRSRSWAWSRGGASPIVPQGPARGPSLTLPAPIGLNAVRDLRPRTADPCLHRWLPLAWARGPPDLCVILPAYRQFHP